MFDSRRPAQRSAFMRQRLNDSRLFDRIQLNDSGLSTESKCLESTEYKFLESTEYKFLERRERLRSPTPAAQRRNSLAQREALGTCSKKTEPLQGRHRQSVSSKP
ncbi:MAG: hypothetical protein DMG82_02660 [Acidobacteria bacterium]|nr:MAG: hypothetical protein DMG82_02660 [Acidobacteriota bacterium]